MSDEVVPELFLIALATLKLITGEAGAAPILLIAEDASGLPSSCGQATSAVYSRI